MVKQSATRVSSKPLNPFAEAFKIALPYFIVGCLWIGLSDKLLGRLFPNLEDYMVFASYKGWFYVAVTAVLVLLLVRSMVKRLKIHQDHLDELVRERTADYEKAMLEAEKSNKSMRFILDSTRDGIYMMDQSGTILNVNLAMAIRQKKTVESIIGTNIKDHMPRELYERRMPQHLKVFETGTPLNYRETRDGICVENWVYPIFEEDGEIKAIALFSADITERIRVEKEIFQSRQMLKEVIDNAPIGIYWKDLDGKYLGCNKVMADSVGTQIENMVGKTNQDFMSNEYELIYSQHDKDILSSGIPKLHYQEKIITKTGAKRILNISKVPLKNEDGIAYALLGVSEDITEQKQKELELIQAKHDANTANRAKSEFLSRMSHEIRTPLNSIIGLTHIARESRDTDKIQGYLEKVDSSSKHLLSIINDILDISRIEAGKMSISNIELDIMAVTEEITNIILPKADEKNQSIDVYIDKELPNNLLSDPIRLKQVLMNLLSNAVKFTPEQGKIAVRIQVVKRIDNQILIKFSVSDNGIGIEKNQIERLFNPFEQADGTFSREYEGTGLGLAISKSIVELMGGDINVQSKEGIGSTFFFTLPFVIGSEKSEKTEIDFDDLKVLVVDDEKETCEYMKSLLAQLRVNTHTAQTGERAIEIVSDAVNEGNPFNVVFVDWRMPGMNGIDTAREIKRIGGENTIVIMISMYEWNDIEQQAKDAGVSLFLPKPIFPARLLNTLQQITSGPPVPAVLPQIVEKDVFLGKRILVAEDILVNQLIIKEMLRETGAAITPVLDGRAAVSEFLSSDAEFDAILMDIQMPILDGLEATRLIRSSGVKNAAAIPIIAMTANVFKEDIDKAMMAGMDAHIGKPIDYNELLAKLSKNMR